MPAPIRVDQLLSGVAPVDVTGPTNAEGTSQAVARADHQHRLEVAVEDDAVAIGARPTLNFVGAGVVVADDGGNDRVDVTIAGSMASTPFQEVFNPPAVTGSDTVVATLSNVPVLGSDPAEIVLTLNGVRQNQGAGQDYTANGTTGAITWLAATGTGIDLLVSDELNAYYRT